MHEARQKHAPARHPRGDAQHRSNGGDPEEVRGFAALPSVARNDGKNGLSENSVETL
ncbi:MAG: hypothetical protein H6853_04935 [Rhodospirillales bacterium]|nr:hypothetical protein [Alphaproteobacteria bacterium]USO02898.1 MAG: hypothetical protein H6853_04935 [Rhodospirillales bacterium]